MSRPQPEARSTLDLAEAFHLGHAVSTLHELKVLTTLRRPLRADTVARRHGLDPGMVRGALEYIAARTELLRKTGAAFAVTTKYSTEACFLLDLYLGAYRQNAVRLPDLLRKPSLAATSVDRVRHAEAFVGVGDAAAMLQAKLIRQLGFNAVLDLGCGSGALLRRLAAGDRRFIGWGLDANPAACRAARAQIRTARLAKRIKVLEGDSRRLRTALPARIRSRVQTVTASHLANEMFRDGPSGAIAWLRGLRRALPGRPLVLSDYYGRLLTNTNILHRQTLLHDYVQLVSGQGIPPPGLAAWQFIYAKAGCRLAHVMEDKATTRFIHVVVL